MKKLTLLLSLFLMVGLVGCTESQEGNETTTIEAEQDYELLVFSKTAGFRHGSIEVAVPAITRYAEERGVAVHATEDASFFTDDSLARFDAVVFVSTTGPLFNEQQQGAFQRYIQNGGGFVGIHAASDINTFPPPDEPVQEWEWYNRLVGAVFQNHPRQQEATLEIVNPDHPSTRMLEEQWVRFDEWYNFREIPDQVEVLIEINTDSYDGSGHPGNHPMAWYHEYDGGRSFYTALGHTDESFTEDELFLQHLWGGIQYAMGAEGAN